MGKFPPVRVVVPTHGRPTLLRRTLISVARCELPDGYEELVVVENGSEAGARNLVKDLPGCVNARYMHRERANKSYALNEALNSIPDGLVVFFDDDVRVHRNALMSYEEAASSYRPGEAFFGGSVQVDRSVASPEWLEPLLPHSIRGYDVGRDREIDWYLGFNWAAFAEDIKQHGGFDPNLGPGSELGTDVGDEVEIQKRLRNDGIMPVDVPGAVVRHHVPPEYCTLEWALRRKYRVGVSKYYRDRGKVSLLRTVTKGVLRSGLQIVGGVLMLNMSLIAIGKGRLWKIAGMLGGFLRLSFNRK